MRAVSFVLLIFLLAAPGAFALPTQLRVQEDADARAVLSRPCIEVTATGRVELPYEGLARAFSSENLLGDLQREYTRQLPAGERPEFVIVQTQPGLYHYVNRSGQESHIREVHRGAHEGPITELVLHTWGKRFFGRFEAVIHVAVRPDEAGGVTYDALVYAWPDNGVSRFLARHLGLVKQYFRSKTREIEALSTRIGAALCASPLARLDGPPNQHIPLQDDSM